LKCDHPRSSRVACISLPSYTLFCKKKNQVVRFPFFVVDSDFHSSLASSPPSALALFFLLFLFSRRFLANNALYSSSSSSFVVWTSSGLYQIGGWVMRAGPPASSAIVKWNPATKVFAGVYLWVIKIISVYNDTKRRCISQDFVGLHKAMLHGLLKTQTRSLLVFQRSDVEWECACLLLYLREDATRVLHFELICDGRVSLVDRRS